MVFLQIKPASLESLEKIKYRSIKRLPTYLAVAYPAEVMP
jgi:hypothetical protein